MLIKIFKGINFTKVPKAKDPYKLYTVIKGKAGKYKSYIYPRKRLLDLVYSNIIRPFNYSYSRGKYFIIFFDNYNKRLKVKVLESKNNIYKAYLRYIAQNEQGDIRICRFRIDYSSKYSNYNFNNLHIN